MVLNVLIKIRVFSLNWAVQFKKKTLIRKEEGSIFILHANSFSFFCFPIWSTGSEYIWTQLTKHGNCWLLRNTVYSSLTGNRGTLTLLCVAAMEEIFWASVAKMAIKLEVTLCLFQIRELSIFNVHHSKSACCNEP